MRIDDDLSGAETIEWFEPSGVGSNWSPTLDLDELIALADLIIEGTEISAKPPGTCRC